MYHKTVNCLRNINSIYHEYWIINECESIHKCVETEIKNARKPNLRSMVNYEYSVSKPREDITEVKILRVENDRKFELLFKCSYVDINFIHWHKKSNSYEKSLFSNERNIAVEKVLLKKRVYHGIKRRFTKTYHFYVIIINLVFNELYKSNTYSFILSNNNFYSEKIILLILGYYVNFIILQNLIIFKYIMGIEN